MTIVSRDEERVIQRLVAFAGDPSIFEDALSELRHEVPEPPTLDQLLKKILEIRVRKGLGQPVHAAAGA